MQFMQYIGKSMSAAIAAVTNLAILNFGMSKELQTGVRPLLNHHILRITQPHAEKGNEQVTWGMNSSN